MAKFIYLILRVQMFLRRVNIFLNFSHLKKIRLVQSRQKKVENLILRPLIVGAAGPHCLGLALDDTSLDARFQGGTMNHLHTQSCFVQDKKAFNITVH